MSAEVAADLRQAARGVRDSIWADRDVLADRLEALADSFDQEGTLGFDRTTGQMVQLEHDGWCYEHQFSSQRDPLWRFPAAVSAQEEPT